MANVIQPDLQFVKELQDVGGESLKKCYQCATCSVACPLSPAENPFPRKEMVWAQWGLKDKLESDIDIWLCHRCGQCSDLCPRGAKPAELLAALRNQTYRKLVAPTVIGEWMSSPAGLCKLAAIPAAIYGVLWILRSFFVGMFPKFEEVHHHWEVVEEGGKVVYGGLFPGDYFIDPIFVTVFALVVFSFYMGVRKLYAGFESTPKTFVVGGREEVSWVKAIVEVITGEVAKHTKFKDCGNDERHESKFKGHFLLMYAFLALLIVTSVVAVTHWGGYVIPFLAPVGHTPMHLLNPVKILANVGAIALIAGLVFLTKNRLTQDDSKQGSSWYDWYLLGVIWAVGLTGIFCELLRLANVAFLAYPMYYLHLISVFMLIAYLPWSKLGHLVYRIAALVWAYKNGRVPMQPKEEKVFSI